MPRPPNDIGQSHVARVVPPPPSRTSWDNMRERHLEREKTAGHLDAHDRAEVLTLIEGQIEARCILGSQAHQAARLPNGTLFDASLSTDRLREALAALRALPSL